jgi:hydroxypyruvate reductase
MGMDPFEARSLRESPQGEIVQRVLQAAVRAVDPAAAVARSLIREGDLLTVGEKTWNLGSIRRLWLVGAGKAGAPMAHAAARILGDVITAGLVIVKEGYAGNAQEWLPDRIKIVEAGHPLPDERGLKATLEMLELLSHAGENDLVLCLLSGGGSALLTLPAEGLTLADLQQTTASLLACGASIDEINALRKHLDLVKDGGLARAAAPAELLALILSDVVGDPLEIIASGPTVADTSTFAEALTVIAQYRLEDQTPPAVLAHLREGQAGRFAETLKLGDPIFSRVYNRIIASNRQAALAGLAEAHSCGMNPLLLTTYLQGEARQVGRTLAAIARQMAASDHPLPRPACIAVGGETTVVVRGDGLGGRNLEVALGAVVEMAGLEDLFLVTLATDGGDGPTDAAGAVVSGTTLQRARELGLRPDDFLERNDSYHFFEPLGDLLKTGPTQTNVNDLAFLFAF